MSRTGAASASSKAVETKLIIERIKDATGASEEDICTMLSICGGDPNDATEKLLASAWLEEGRRRG